MLWAKGIIIKLLTCKVPAVLLRMFIKLNVLCSNWVTTTIFNLLELLAAFTIISQIDGGDPVLGIASTPLYWQFSTQLSKMNIFRQCWCMTSSHNFPSLMERKPGRWLIMSSLFALSWFPKATGWWTVPSTVERIGGYRHPHIWIMDIYLCNIYNCPPSWYGIDYILSSFSMSCYIPV